MSEITLDVFAGPPPYHCTGLHRAGYFRRAWVEADVAHSAASTMVPMTGKPKRGRRQPSAQLNFLIRIYVILVLPKCLLTWGYAKADAAAFCLQHQDRHGESAGPVEI